MELSELKQYRHRLLFDKAVVKEAARTDKSFNELLGCIDSQVTAVEKLINKKTADEFKF